MKESWAWLNGWTGVYEVSNHGRVRSHVSKTPRLLTPTNNGHGYMSVMLKDHTRRYVHRLVAAAFCGRPSGANYVNHKDFDTSNNRDENLEWVTAKQNSAWSNAHGRLRPPLTIHLGKFGQAHPMAKLTDDQAREIKWRVLFTSESSGAIAEDYPVSDTTVRLIGRGLRYQNVEAAVPERP